MVDKTEQIKEKVLENEALLTMILDEVQGIYNLEEGNRVYELDRLKSTLITSLYMVSERNQYINSLTDSIMDMELKGDRT